MALHHSQRTTVGIANVKCAQYSVDTTGGYYCVVVLVPVVGENLSWRASGRKGLVSARGVDGDGRDKVVFGGRRCAEIKYADVGV